MTRGNDRRPVPWRDPLRCSNLDLLRRHAALDVRTPNRNGVRALGEDAARCGSVALKLCDSPALVFDGADFSTVLRRLAPGLLTRFALRLRRGVLGRDGLTPLFASPCRLLHRDDFLPASPESLEQTHGALLLSSAALQPLLVVLVH